MDNINDFVTAVQNSKLLTPAQKREFLDRPEMLPEEYREKIVGILEEFDRKNKARVRRVKKQVQNVVGIRI